VVLLQAACLALPRVLAARDYFACVADFFPAARPPSERKPPGRLSGPRRPGPGEESSLPFSARL